MRKKALKKQTKSTQGEVRIISGLWRGQKLPVLNIDGLRPTSDRVKETLFNWLMADIPASRCLDCFTGSGSLAFEALSRQADFVLMLERDHKVVSCLNANLARLRTEKGKVIQTDSLQFLTQHNQDKPFDIVFLDPPFHHNLIPHCLEWLEKNNWLTANALIYLETEHNANFHCPDHWTLLKKKTTQQVIYQLYQRQLEDLCKD
ncbi:16S rRNA (guanine(966)-N(2))-methyltransferase RsmD [Mergibacter septicus]|uniref:16S rRNA (guanine(966)-N(2))-methyltransferase RsmD n=1 Tax=Mergibacter septicus TaxID=221402 RepID=UPI001C75E1A9|nr:16S rRNA (guanine(966)-N(2))-methyltransferase RsmD [Mergibacter septicus]QDJ13607.1 16S rRNA (guanine(966)-N(2))-methyltransferase RsmD [Mergibacter septicus]